MKMRKAVVYALGLVTLCLVTGPLALGKGKSYLVLGVIASADNGVALLKSQSTGETFAARSGQEIEPGIFVKSINRDIVVFLAQGREEKVRVGDEADMGAPPVLTMVSKAETLTGVERTGSTVTISSALRDDLTQRQLTQVLTQAAALPYYEAGQLVGFQLLAIDAGSIYDKLGFINGDIVTAVNGQHLSDVAMTIKLLQDLKQAPRADVTFMRGGKEQTLLVQIR